MVNQVRHDKRDIRQVLIRSAVYFVLVVTGISCLIPFYWMILVAMRPLSEIFVQPPKLLPGNLSAENFITLLRGTPFLRGLLNSIIVSVGFVALSLLFCSLAGFAFAKLRFPGRGVLFFTILALMMVPWTVTFIPLYVEMARLHWTNNFLALIVPGSASAFGIFVFRQYMGSLSDELFAAGVIDGCSTFQLYYRIALPLSWPAVATVAMFMFMGVWNDFLWPLVVLQDPNKYTLPLVLAQMQGGGWQTPFNLLMAGSLLACLPVLAVFFVGQKYFVAGLVKGALKE